MQETRSAYGTFSFTLTAEWDYVPRSKREVYCKNGYTLSIDKRLDMASTVKLLLQSGNWEPYDAVTDISRNGLFPTKKEDIDKAPLFKEYLYFNSHMRKVVYNQTQYTPDDLNGYTKALRENDDAVVVLRWKKPTRQMQFAYYLYRYIDSKTVVQYKLPISSIELRLYSIGVLMLTIRCQDESVTAAPYYSSRQICGCGKVSSKAAVCMAEDTAWIENCGRRLFAARTLSACASDKEKKDFFADHPVLSVIAPSNDGIAVNPFEPLDKRSTDGIVLCDFSALMNPNVLAETVTKPEYLDFLSQLVSKQCMTQMSFRTQKCVSGDCLVLNSYNDDRMYVHGTIESEYVTKLTQSGWQDRQAKDAAEKLSPWYGILYSDPGWNATCQDPAMLISAVEEATEARWCKYGTFHGMTYHSMIMLLGSLKGLEYLSANNDWIYLQMFLIAVLQRCAVQRFYREASGLLQTHSRKDDALRAAVQDKYTLFLNQFWFYEVTEQEQGKVMFSKLQKAMNIERDVEFLDRALEELHQQQENRTGSMVNKLLVPMSILGGFWAFTEMGLKLREAIGTSALFSLLNRDFWHGCAWVLLLCIVIGMGWYVCNQLRYIGQLWGRTAGKIFETIKRFIANGGWILLLIPIVGMLFTVISIHL